MKYALIAAFTTCLAGCLRVQEQSHLSEHNVKKLIRHAFNDD